MLSIVNVVAVIEVNIETGYIMSSIFTLQIRRIYDNSDIERYRGCSVVSFE